MTALAPALALPTSPFDNLAGQPLVARFLSTAIQKGHMNPAYLFVGPIGSGKTEAALLLAQAVLCPDAGCGSCDDCTRAQARTHPDLHIIEPEGVEGYLTDQIRNLIRDATMAPIRSKAKVYVLTRADLLSSSAANAFLKTLEEPPVSVTFILMARTAESVLETLRSRCQMIAFRFIPEVEAVQMLVETASATEKDARQALAAVGGSPMRARVFLRSQLRKNTRVEVLQTVERMLEADALDVLEAARQLMAACKTPLDDLVETQTSAMDKSKDFLTKGGVTALEKQFKRQLTARERELIAEAFNIIDSWLRDCLLVRIGRTEDIVNTDFHYNITKAATKASDAGLICALRATDQARERMHYNVSVQSVFESLLFTIREVLENHA
jgi:DNA polymerase-3 subunit delta'